MQANDRALNGVEALAPLSVQAAAAAATEQAATEQEAAAGGSRGSGGWRHVTGMSYLPPLANSVARKEQQQDSRKSYAHMYGDCGVWSEFGFDCMYVIPHQQDITGPQTL